MGNTTKSYLLGLLFLFLFIGLFNGMGISEINVSAAVCTDTDNSIGADPFGVKSHWNLSELIGSNGNSFGSVPTDINDDGVTDIVIAKNDWCQIYALTDTETENEIVFQDNFETDLSAWKVIDSNGSSQYAVSNEHAHYGSKSVKMTFAGGGGGLNLEKSFNEQRAGVVEVWYYDTLQTTTRQTLNAYADTYGSGKYLHIGAHDNPENYVVREGNNVIDTGIKRTKGWHRFKMEFEGTVTSLSIDDFVVYLSKEMGTFNMVRLSTWASTKPAYFDDFQIRNTAHQHPKIFEDNFETDLSAWKVVDWNGSSQYALSNEYAHYGSKSVKLAFAGGGGGLNLEKSFNEQRTGVVEVWYYDTLQTTARQTLNAYADTYGSGKYLHIGAHDNPENYVVREGLNVVDTGIKRTEGWHRFKMLFDGYSTTLYIDNLIVRTSTHIGTFNMLRLSTWGGTEPAYFDDFTISNLSKDILWKTPVFSKHSPNYYGVNVMDIDNDGIDEAIIVGDGIWVVDARNGNLKWSVDNIPLNSGDNPAWQLCRLTDPLKYDIVMNTERSPDVFAYRYDGVKLWEVDIKDAWYGHTITCADLNGDGLDEVLVPLNGKTVAINNTGQILWERITIVGESDFVEVCDFNNDGQMDIFHDVSGGAGGEIELMDGLTGERISAFKDVGHFQMLQCGDIRPDLPGLEIAYVTRGGIKVRDNNYNLLWEREVSGLHELFDLADWDGDGELDLMTSTIKRGMWTRERSLTGEVVIWNGYGNELFHKHFGYGDNKERHIKIESTRQMEWSFDPDKDGIVDFSYCASDVEKGKFRSEMPVHLYLTGVRKQPEEDYNNAEFVSQSVPNSMEAGNTYEVSVTMENTGTSAWTATNKYRLGSQNPRDNFNWGTNRVYLSSTESITPGNTKTFTFDVIAPSTPGTYNFQWKMLEESKEWFGEFTDNVSVSVQGEIGKITIQGENFYLDGQKWFPFGTSYWPSHFSHIIEPERIGSWYASPYYEDNIEVIEKDLSKIKELGFNSIWVVARVSDTPPGSKENFVDFLSRAKNHNLRVGLSFHACNPFQNNHKSKCAELIKTLDDLGITQDNNIFAYDLAWEIRAGQYDNRNSLLNREWVDWIINRYGTIESAENAWNYDLKEICTQRDSIAISHNIPSKMIAGQKYNVKISVKNTGTKNWTKSNSYKLGAYDDSSMFANTRHHLNDFETIKPRQIKIFNFEMTAPDEPGIYYSGWKMLQEHVAWFGEKISQKIIVVDSGEPVQETINFDENFACGPTDTELCNDGPANKMVAAYRRFIDDYSNKEFFAIIQEIKKYDKEHLITVRMGYGGNGIRWVCEAMPLDIRTTSKYMDFISYESWNYSSSDDIKESGFISNYGNVGKPTINIEFGGCGCYAGADCSNCMDTKTPEEQKIYYQRVFDMMIESGTKGSFNWWFKGIRPNEKSDYGIVRDNNNADDKPVCDIVRSYANQMKNLPDRTPNYWITVDRDAHAGKWQMYQTGRVQYLSALNAGKTPGVKTVCADKTSKDVLSHDGVLPKCLNALFESLQVKNFSGTWVDVKNGDKIEVGNNSPLYARVSVGNLGEAKWLATGSVGAVRLGGNENHGLNFRKNIVNEVQGFESYDFGEFKFFDGIAEQTNVRFQMVSEFVNWFGEFADITLIPNEPECNPNGTDMTGKCSTVCGASVGCDGTEPNTCSYNSLKKCDSNCQETASCGDGTCNCGETTSNCLQDCPEEESCTDTDGGYKIYEKGTACRPLTVTPGELFCKTDECLSATSLKEYYCKDDKMFSKTITCENTCEDGACKQIEGCLKQGETYMPGENKQCCSGLEAITRTQGDGTNCTIPMGYVCASSVCGNGKCEGPYENACSCPEDCKESECAIGEEKKHTCPDGAQVPWCACINEASGVGTGLGWACIDSPENACLSEPKPISKMTVAELKAEIVRIMAQIKQLQILLAQMQGQGISSIPSDFTFNNNLRLYMRHPDVVYLKFILDEEVEHSDWKSTDYFGSKTLSAVKAFQNKYKQEISNTFGYTIRASGFAGPGTRSKLNEILGNY